MSNTQRLILEPLTASEERQLAELYVNIVLPWPTASSEAKNVWYPLFKASHLGRQTIFVTAAQVAAAYGKSDSASGRRALSSLDDSALSTIKDRDRRRGVWHLAFPNPRVIARDRIIEGDPQFSLVFSLDELELPPSSGARDFEATEPTTALPMLIRSAPIPQPTPPRENDRRAQPAERPSGPQRVPVNRLAGTTGPSNGASLGSQMQKLVDGWCSDASLARRTQELTDWIMREINDPDTQPHNIMLLAEAVVVGKVKRSDFLQVLHDANRTKIHSSRGAYIMKGFLRVLQQSGVERWTKRRPTIGR